MGMTILYIIIIMVLWTWNLTPLAVNIIATCLAGFGILTSLLLTEE